MTDAVTDAEALPAAAPADDEIAAAVERLRPDLARLARELYDEPEIGFEEHASVARISALLRAHGVDAEVGAFGLDTALRARAGADAAASAPHFAIIAEYDALPGIGHACGHNIIAGVAVGAFLAAAPIVARLGGRLSLIGTPAEENGGGKELIIRAGGFDDVDAADGSGASRRHAMASASTARDATTPNPDARRDRFTVARPHPRRATAW